MKKEMNFRFKGGKMNKKEIIAMKTIGYWSTLSGVEVKKIHYGTEDYCICVSGAWCSQKSIHQVKIHYETERAYIIVRGTRLHFNECIRT